MSDSAVTGIVTIATAIVGIAILAVLVSKNAQTPAVIAAAGNALGSDITAAVAPVTSNGATAGGWQPVALPMNFGL